MIPARYIHEGQARGGDVKNNSRCMPGVRLAKRVGIAVVGGAVTLIGIALIVLPGPAIVVIPLGLSILATEFVWANRLLEKSRRMTSRVAGALLSGVKRPA